MDLVTHLILSVVSASPFLQSVLHFLSQFALDDYGRFMAIAGWSGVLYNTRVGAWKMLTAPLEADLSHVIGAMFHGTALSIMGFLLRRYIAGDSQLLYFGLHLFSILVAITISAVILIYKKSKDRCDG